MFSALLWQWEVGMDGSAEGLVLGFWWQCCPPGISVFGCWPACPGIPALHLCQTGVQFVGLAPGCLAQPWHSSIGEWYLQTLLLWVPWARAGVAWLPTLSLGLSCSWWQGELRTFILGHPNCSKNAITDIKKVMPSSFGPKCDTPKLRVLRSVCCWYHAGYRLADVPWQKCNCQECWCSSTCNHSLQTKLIVCCWSPWQSFGVCSSCFCKCTIPILSHNPLNGIYVYL